MPWCDACTKYWAPNTVDDNGACPECKTVLATRGALRMEARSLGVPAPGETEGEVPKAPWHFKLAIGALVGYLSWRAWQLIVYVF